jgi:hypothetical protein
MPIFEVCAEVYHWNLRECLWGLTLPQLFGYLDTRANRLEKEQSSSVSDAPSGGGYAPSGDDESWKQQRSWKQKQAEEKAYQASLEDENLLPISTIVKGLGFSGQR